MKKTFLVLFAGVLLNASASFAQNAPTPPADPNGTPVVAPPPTGPSSGPVAICPAMIDTQDPICVYDLNRFGDRPNGALKQALWTGSVWKYYPVPPNTNFTAPGAYLECPAGMHKVYSIGRVPTTPVEPPVVVVNPPVVTYPYPYPVVTYPVVTYPVVTYPVVTSPWLITPVTPFYRYKLKVRGWGF